MPKPRSWILTLVVLFACSPNSPQIPVSRNEGYSVGNGGGPLKSLFELGRGHSLYLLRTIRIDAETGPLVEWLAKNRGALIEDIARSPHIWSQPTFLICPESACGCTQAEEMGNAIWLNERGCASAATVSDASRVLIHESVHHLAGNDEAFADAIAALVQRLGAAQGVGADPSWRSFPAPALADSGIELGFGGAGKSAWILYDEGLAQPSPSGLGWQIVRASDPNAFWKYWDGEFYNEEGCSVRVGEQVWVIRTATETGVWGFIVFDVATGRWRSSSLSAPGPGEPRWEAKCGTVGDQVVVWGGTDSEENLLDDGWFFNTKTLTANQILEAPLPAAAGALVIFGRSDFMIWGGAISAFPDRPKASTQGALYDLSTRAWKQLPELGSPPGKFLPLGTWTGAEYLVYGGYEGFSLNGQTIPPVHGFNPETWQWNHSPNPGPSGGRVTSGSFASAWTGALWVVAGASAGFYEPTQKSWTHLKDLVPPASIAEGHSIRSLWNGLGMVVWNENDAQFHWLVP